MNEPEVRITGNASDWVAFVTTKHHPEIRVRAKRLIHERWRFRCDWHGTHSSSPCQHAWAGLAAYKELKRKGELK